VKIVRKKGVWIMSKIPNPKPEDVGAIKPQAPPAPPKRGGYIQKGDNVERYKETLMAIEVMTRNISPTMTFETLLALMKGVHLVAGQILNIQPNDADNNWSIAPKTDFSGAHKTFT
jgi:hypothetical protein